MRIVELETELAFSALMQKLTDGEFVVYPSEAGSLSCAVEVAPEQDLDFGRILTHFTFTEWLFAHISQRMNAMHAYLTDDEQEYVSLLAFHGLRKTEETIAGLYADTWQQVIGEAIQQVLEAAMHPFMSVDGVVRFRARAYLAAADTAIHEMVEQFLADREYEEFVSMLRYMLEAQPPNNQVLHVYSGDDRIWLTDETGTLVKDTEVSRAAQQVSDESNVNSEDLAMSILITRSPCSIVIHDLTHAPPWPSFAETVERVFLDRAVRCVDCSTCVQLRKPEDVTRHAEGTHQSAMPDKYD